VVRDTEPDPPAAEQFWNAGFENHLSNTTSIPFYWTFTSQSQALIDIDTDHPHSGHRSLRIVFSAPTKLETISISQTIVVQPNSQYRFAYFVRTRDLKTGSAPQIALLDAANNANFVQSAPTPTGTNDWQEISCDFRTKPTTQAIKLMMYRESCGEAQLCPIFGKVWYDDFNLQRSGGAIASR
jgi:hypothetical protein